MVGVYVPSDPGAPDELAKQGLRDLIHLGKACPSFIVSHELLLTKAPEGYQHFNTRDNRWTKVVPSPAA